MNLEDLNAIQRILYPPQDWIARHQLIIGWAMGLISAPVGNLVYARVERWRSIQRAPLADRE